MNERLTIQDLTDLLATKHGMTKKDAEAFVKEFFLLIEEALKSENYVKIKGLGTFKLIDVDSRESVNVNTGERFQIKGHTKVSFTPDTNLRDTINKPFSHFETVVLNDNTVLDDTPIDEAEGEEEDTIEEVQVQVNEEIVIIDENSQNEVHSEDESIEDVVIEEDTEIEEPIVKDEPSQEIEQTQEEIPASPVEELPKATEITAEQIIAQEVLKANIKLDNIPGIQPEVIEQKVENNINVPKKEKNPVPFLITVIVIVLLLCGGAILFIYYPDLFSPSSNKEMLDMPVTQPEKQDIQFTDTVEKRDTLTKSLTETPIETAKVQPEVKKKIENATKSTTLEAKETKPASSAYSDSETYNITGTKATHTIKEGESLTKVALKYYGTKALWPYIVKHNAGVIKNPDNVPYGTTIKIPELTKK